MKLTIEKISEQYLKDAHKIYNYYIVNSYSNFEEKKLTFNQFHSNYKNIIKNKLPYLVAITVIPVAKAESVFLKLFLFTFFILFFVKKLSLSIYFF